MSTAEQVSERSIFGSRQLAFCEDRTIWNVPRVNGMSACGPRTRDIPQPTLGGRNRDAGANIAIGVLPTVLLAAPR